ncbi:MAG: hypothetical protein AAFN77_09295 [Planctomycetota bacterium]
MNAQPWMIVRSMMTESRIINWGGLLMVGISLLNAYFGVFHLAIMVASLYAIGVGASVHQMRQWEVGRLVPKLLMRYTQVALLVALVFMVASATLIVLTDGPVIGWIGVSCLSIICGVWIGSGDRLSAWLYVPLLVGFMLCLLTAFLAINGLFVGPFVDTIESQFNRGIALITGQQQRIGYVSFILTLLVATRVWWFGTSQVLAGGDLAVRPNDKGEHSTKTGVAEIRESDLSRNLIQFRWLRLYELVTPNRWTMPSNQLKTFSTLSIIAAVLLIGRSQDLMIAMFVWVAVVFTAVLPVSCFYADVTQRFERFWMMGIDVDRMTTARRFITISAIRNLIAIVLSTLGVLILVPFDSPHMTLALLSVITSSAIGGLLVLLLSTFFCYFKNLSDLMALFQIGLVSTIFFCVIVIFVANNISIAQIESWIEAVGSNQLILVSSLASLAIWLVTWQVGAASLASQTRLLES